MAGTTAADPGSVIFDGVQAARGRGSDVVLIDTAGRMQTQRNLVEELAKVGRVAAKAPGDQRFASRLVLDATAGTPRLGRAARSTPVAPFGGGKAHTEAAAVEKVTELKPTSSAGCDAPFAVTVTSRGTLVAASMEMPISPIVDWLLRGEITSS